MHLKRILFSTLFLGFSTLGLAEFNISNNQVSATFEDMTLEEALTEISDKTGIRILSSHPLDSKVKLGFKQTSLEKMLARLLSGYNVSYIRNQQKAIKEIRIFAVGNAPRVAKESSKQQSSGTAVHKDGHFYINAIINGTSVRLLVDTGASQLSISSSLATKLKLTTNNGSVAVNTAGGKIQATPVIIDSFMMAGKELKGVQAIVLPQLKENGLVGQNILAHFRSVTEGKNMHFEPIGMPAPNNEEKEKPANNPATNPNKNQSNSSAPKR